MCLCPHELRYNNHPLPCFMSILHVHIKWRCYCIDCADQNHLNKNLLRTRNYLIKIIGVGNTYLAYKQISVRNVSTFRWIICARFTAPTDGDEFFKHASSIHHNDAKKCVSACERNTHKPIMCSQKRVHILLRNWVCFFLILNIL